MTRARLILVFAAAFLVVLVALFPLRLGLGLMQAQARGLSASAVTGSIWSGRLSGATLGSAPLGEVRAGLDVLGLFRGGGRVWVRAEGPIRARGVLQLGGAAFALEDMDATLPSSLVLPGLPVQGRLQLTDFTAAFRHGDCRKAAGTVRLADVSVGAASGLVLEGKARCQGRRLAIPLEGQAQGVGLQALLTVDGRGRYEVQSLIRSSDANLAATNGMRGLERTLEGYRRIDRGRIGVR
jgi:general secretion pathway protein N